MSYLVGYKMMFCKHIHIRRIVSINITKDKKITDKNTTYKIHTHTNNFVLIFYKSISSLAKLKHVLSWAITMRPRKFTFFTFS